MRVEVYRAAGDRQGDDVEAPMLSTTAMLIERGRVEMDRNAHQMVACEADIVPRAGIRLGQLGGVENPITAERRVGKCTGIAYRITGGDVSQEITLERPQ